MPGVVTGHRKAHTLRWVLFSDSAVENVVHELFLASRWDAVVKFSFLILRGQDLHTLAPSRVIFSVSNSCSGDRVK